MERVGAARIVLLGEASHGTHEFYRERARITKRLIGELGFTAVAIEGDWPDAYRVNRYVHGAGTDADAEEALRGFRRFPTWMWRNADVVDFVGWLRAHNDRLSRPEARAGVYGLDLYSLGASMEAVIGYLDGHDPAAAERARRRYECLRPYAGASGDYGQAVLLGVSESCRRHVLAGAGGPAPARRRLSAPRRAGRRGRVLLRRAERRPHRRRGGVLPHHVRRPRRLVEPARPPHGRHPRSPDGPPRSPRQHEPGGRLGAQLAHRRRPGHGDGGARGGQHRPAHARAPRP